MSVERTAEEWGRVAVSLPGWRWMPQMLDTSGLILLESPNKRSLKVKCWDMHDPGSLGTYSSWLMLLDPDDPATAGCLEYLLGGPVAAHAEVMADPVAARLWVGGHAGRARIAAAEALGRWPGGGR